MIRWFYLLALATLFAACGGSPPSYVTSSANLAYVRFANEAPNAPDPSNVNNPLKLTEVVVDGNAVGSIEGPPLVRVTPAASVTGYIGLSPGIHSVSFGNAQLGIVQAKMLGPYATPSLSAGNRYTIVLAGTWCRSASASPSPPPAFDNLQLMTFTDPASVTTPTIEVYNAAPTVAQTVTAAVYPAPSGTPGPVGMPQSIGSAAVGQSLVVPVPGTFASGFGVALTTASGATAPPLTPSAVNPNDAANALSFNVETAFAIFVSDNVNGCPNPTSGFAPSANGTLGV